MKRINILGLAAVAAAMSIGTQAEVIPRDYGAIPQRRNGFRRGRRFDMHGRPVVDRSGNRPAGSKLAKQAAKGTLTITRIR